MKRFLDLVLAAAALVLLSPVLLGVALAIRLTMGSPVVFRQSRAGKDGEIFKIRKFRTMRDLRPGEEPVVDDAARITRLGHFLRSTSLDELPELLNIIEGTMSVVGPRPLLPEYLPLYNAEQARRHRVRPGLTGWAQVNGRNAISWEDKFAQDVWYVDNRSTMLDLRIVWRPALAVARRDGISAQGTETAHLFTGSSPSGEINGPQ